MPAFADAGRSGPLVGAAATWRRRAPWAGAAVSLAGHAALIALAVWAMPWLRARPGDAVPAIRVSIVGTAELAALQAAAARPAVAPATPAPPSTRAPAAPAPPSTRAPVAPPVTAPSAAMPGDEPEVAAPVPDLAPGFDAEAPLGAAQPGFAAVLLAAPATRAPAVPGRMARLTLAEAAGRPRPRPAAAAAAPAYRAAVGAAVARARIYPPEVREAGVEGVAVVQLVVGRDGRLRTGWLARPSGSAALDRAALDAVRDAALPAPPPGLPDAELAFRVPVGFALDD